jgi:cytochrome P450
MLPATNLRGAYNVMIRLPPVPAEAQHEVRLVFAANPLLFALLTLGRFIGPVAKVPRIGWVVTDPQIARRLLGDSAHTSLLGEGGVGHLWAQLLGDWVNDAFDGPGHADLRERARDLFTEANAKRHVARVFQDPAARLTETLHRGATVDIAEIARVWVGRMVADLLGLPVADSRDDAAFRSIFAHGERLAALARGTIGSTVISPAVVAEGRRILKQLTAAVPEAYGTAGTGTLLGRCREARIPLREARGLASLLLVAGTETAASAMARGVALLHDTGQQHALLTAPGRVPGAVREILRVTTPAPLIGRHITADVEASGKTLRCGEQVLMLTYTANNAVGPFDIRRPPEPKIGQLWFGAGQHLCLGAPLARAEITYLLETLLAQRRPWHVVRRRAARQVLIPSYAELLITCGRQATAGRSARYPGRLDTEGKVGAGHA